jgi:hypothetical protein
MMRNYYKNYLDMQVEDLHEVRKKEVEEKK